MAARPFPHLWQPVGFCAIDSRAGGWHNPPRNKRNGQTRDKLTVGLCGLYSRPNTWDTTRQVKTASDEDMPVIIEQYGIL